MEEGSQEDSKEHSNTIYWSGSGKINSPALQGDAGHDIHANETVVIDPYSTALIPTGVHIEMPGNMVGILKEKSGLASKGLVVGAGVLDAGYRGEIRAVLRNFTKDPLEIKKGDKIGQFIFFRFEQPRLIKKEALSESERGARGFGSTGLR